MRVCKLRRLSSQGNQQTVEISSIKPTIFGRADGIDVPLQSEVHEPFKCPIGFIDCNIDYKRVYSFQIHPLEYVVLVRLPGLTSRSHATISWDDKSNEFVLIDHKSVNGTYHNSTRSISAKHIRPIGLFKCCLVWNIRRLQTSRFRKFHFALAIESFLDTVAAI